MAHRSLTNNDIISEVDEVFTSEEKWEPVDRGIVGRQYHIMYFRPMRRDTELEANRPRQSMVGTDYTCLTPRTQVALKILHAGIIASGKRSIDKNERYNVVLNAIEAADSLLFLSQGELRHWENQYRPDEEGDWL